MSTISNETISNYLSKHEVPHSMLGYKYLMLCLRAMLDGAVNRYRMQSVYEYVAEASGVKPEQVDRAIRTTIRRTSAPAMNKEFLTRAYDELMLTADANASVF